MPIIVEYNHLDRCAAVVLSATDDLCTDIARDMQQAAKNSAPVMTGALQRGINLVEGNPAEVTASSIEGGAMREYAQYNEYGTRHMSAQPFMMPGFVSGLARVPVHARAYGAKIEAAA